MPSGTPLSSTSPAPSGPSAKGRPSSFGTPLSTTSAVPSALCTCFPVLHFACGHLNPQYLTNKTTSPRNQRASRFLNIPDRAFYLLSSRLFLLFDLLGSHRTRLSQTVKDVIYIFFSESRVFVLFLLSIIYSRAAAESVKLFLTVLLSQKWLGRAIDDLCDVQRGSVLHACLNVKLLSCGHCI